MLGLCTFLARIFLPLDTVLDLSFEGKGEKFPAALIVLTSVVWIFLFAVCQGTRLGTRLGRPF